MRCRDMRLNPKSGLDDLKHGLKQDGGFTLVELATVMAVLSVVSATAIFSVSGLTERSRAAACRADVATVTFAGQAYSEFNGRAAGTIDDLVSGGYLRAAPADVSYTVVGTAFTAVGRPACP